MPETITDARLEDILDSDDTWVIRVYASWAGGAGTIFESAADAFDDVHFGEVDIEEHQDAANELDVRSIPTTVILDGGEEVDRQTSVVKESIFKEWIAEHTGADDTSHYPSENLP